MAVLLDLSDELRNLAGVPLRSRREEVPNTILEGLSLDECDEEIRDSVEGVAYGCSRELADSKAKRSCTML